MKILYSKLYYSSQKETLICFIGCVWILLLVLLPTSGYAQNNKSIPTQIEFLEDPDDSFSFTQIQSGATPTPFKSLGSNDFDFGFTGSVFWFRIKPNPNFKAQLLEVGYPSLDNITLFIPGEKGAYSILRSGDRYQFSERYINYRNIVFPIPIHWEGKTDLYLRVHSTGTLRIPLRLHAQLSLNERLYLEHFLYGLFFGVMAVMVLYNFFLFLSIRDRTYFYYVVYITANIFFQLVLSGFAFQFIWPNQIDWAHYSAAIFLGLIAVSLLLFTRRFLNTREQAPFLNEFIKYVVVVQSVALVLAPFLDHSVNARLMVLGGISSTSLGMLAGWRVLAKGYRPARYFVAAFFLFLLFATLHGFSRTKWLEAGFFAQYGLMLGMLVEVVLISLALADRINTLKKKLVVLNQDLELKVTERTEKLRESNLKLRELDRIKTDFFANISHEIRTPLTLILSPLDLLLEEATANQERDKISEYETMRRNGRRLLKLINDLLDLSRFDASQMPFQFHPVELKSFVSKLMASFDSTAAEQELEFTFDARGPVYAEIDPEHMEKAFLNVLSNAFKFTNKGGIYITLNTNGKTSEIIIRDTGIGVSPGEHELIFERFKQSEQGDRRRYGGSGIGLALAREIMRSHKGDLTIVSEQGEGASFILTLPLSSASAPEKLPSPAPILEADTEYREAVLTESGQRRRSYRMEPSNELLKEIRRSNNKVLIVEDNEDMRDHLSNILGAHFTLTTAANGKQGLVTARKIRPALILSDLMMPELDGMGMLEALKKDKDLKRIPIIFLTARADLTTRMKGLLGGIDDYILKPFHPNELLLKIQNIMLKKLARENDMVNSKQEIYEDLHDYLGSSLTDLTMAINRLKKNLDLPEETRTDLTQLMRKVTMDYRYCLSSAEDLEYFSENFTDAMRYSLLRRYSGYERELLFEAPNGLPDTDPFEGRSDGFRRELYKVIMEAATNDLKYGQGAANWRLKDSIKPGYALTLSLHSTTEYHIRNPHPGRGERNINKRIKNLGGSVTSHIENGVYHLEIDLPEIAQPAEP